MRKIGDATYGKPPAGRLRRRLYRGKRWFLLDAGRWVVSAILLVATFAVIVLVGTLGPVPVESFLTAGIAPGAVFVELLKMIVSVVVIVLSINQLVLSPGLGPVGEQRDRYEGAMELRSEVEAHTGVRTSPTAPAHFLEVLLEAIEDQARSIRALAVEAPDDAFRDEVTSYADAVLEETEQVERAVANTRYGEFGPVSATLRFALSEKVRTLRDLRALHGDRLSAEEAAAFDEMDDRLELFAVAREYLKTVYIRSEYIDLSQGLLYIGLPTVVLTYLAAQVYEPTIFPGTTAGIDTQLLFVSGAVTVALAPFALLVSYVFRLAALSRSTLFVGPFAARSRRSVERETD